MWRKEDIVKQLKQKQKASGQSLRSYANTIGCSAAYLSDVYNNRRDPGEKILTHLGVEVEVTVTKTYKPKLKWRKDE